MTNDHQDLAASPIDDVLASAVDGVHLAFRRHAGYARSLDICGYCCVSEATARRLEDVPPAQLPAHGFYEYNGSAKSEIQRADEVGHFLPRMLALLANGEEIHHSLEIALDRLGRCPADSWNAQELVALDSFALAYFDAVLCGSLAYRRFDDPLCVLLMFHIGGVPIAPLLRRWENCDHPSATVQFVEATYWNFWGEDRYVNAFANDRPEFLQQVHDWLQDPACRSRFARRLTAADFLAVAENVRGGGCMSFALMADAVFDRLTR